jgi:hypothetical protein
MAAVVYGDLLAVMIHAGPQYHGDRKGLHGVAIRIRCIDRSTHSCIKVIPLHIMHAQNTPKWLLKCAELVSS